MSAPRGALCAKPYIDIGTVAILPSPPSRGSAHEIEAALQLHKKSGRAPDFLSPESEKVSERELSDVRVRPEPNTLVGKAKAFRQGKKNPVPKGTGFSSHLRISPEKLRLPGMRQRRYHNLHKRLR